MNYKQLAMAIALMTEEQRLKPVMLESTVNDECFITRCHLNICGYDNGELKVGDPFFYVNLDNPDSHDLSDYNMEQFTEYVGLDYTPGSNNRDVLLEMLDFNDKQLNSQFTVFCEETETFHFAEIGIYEGSSNEDDEYSMKSLADEQPYVLRTYN